MNLFIKYSAVTALSVFCTLTLTAQNVFSPGFIVADDNLEVRGFVSAGSWRETPSEISFRESDTSLTVNFKPADIKAFRAGDLYFISANVDIDVSPASVSELLKSQYTTDAVHMRAWYEANSVSTEQIIPEGEITYREDDSIKALKPENINEVVFLQLLVNGPLKLFYYKAPSGKDHFYISGSPGIYEELCRIWYADDTQQPQLIVYEVEFYKNLLLKNMGTEPGFKDRILKMNFSRKSLTDIFVDYNNKMGAVPDNYVSREESWSYRYGPVAGGGTANLAFISGMSGHRELGLVRFGLDPSVMAGLQGEVIFPGAGRRFSLYNELAVRWNNLEGTGYKAALLSDTLNYDASFNLIYLRLAQMIRVRLATGVVQPFLGVGVSYSFILMDRNSLTTTRNNVPQTTEALADPKNNEQALCAGAGVLFKKVSVEARYEFGNGYSKYYSLSGTTRTFMLIGTYSF